METSGPSEPLILTAPSIKTSPEALGLDSKSNNTSLVATNSSSHPPVVSQRTYSKGTYIPVFKWGLKFDTDSGQSVGSFLDRVEELRKARGLTYE